MAGTHTDLQPAPRQPVSRRAFLIVAGVITLLACIITTSTLLSPRPLDGHEVFVAQSAREMIQRDSYIIPYFNDEPRLKKPPLMYWAVIGVAKIFPDALTVPPWAARLPSLIAGAVLIALTTFLGAVVYDRRTGILAGALALTAIGFFDDVTSARPEMLYAACGALLTLGFAGAWMSPDRSRRQFLWSLSAWVGFALAALAKGPHLPLIIMGGFILALLLDRKAKRILPVIRPVSGLIITTAALGTWIGLVLMDQQDALDIWRHELLGNSAAKSANPILSYISPFYLHAIPTLVLPWILPLIFGLFVTFMPNRPDLRQGRALFWVIIFTALVMTIPDHRRVYYMLPLLPALTVLMARGTLDCTDRLASSEQRRDRALVLSISALHALAAVGVFVLISILSQDHWIPIAIVGAVAAITGTILLVRFRSTSNPNLPLAAAVVPWIIILLASAHASGWWQPKRYRLWEFAQRVAEHAGPTDPVYMLGGLEPVFVYALDRPIRRVTSLDAIPVPNTGQPLWIITSPRNDPRTRAEPIPDLSITTIDSLPPRDRFILLEIQILATPDHPDTTE